MCDGEVIARELFMSCEKSNLYRGKYLILIDGNFLHTFSAKDEDTAIVYFRGFVEGMKCERERRNTQ